MEQRNLNSDFTFDTEGRTVEGMAVVFDSPSEDLGWTEVIHRGAITNETIEKSDVFATFNHQDDKVLARSKNGKGSLLLEVDDKGLRYMFEAPKTATGDELLEYLQRGDLSSSSFAFSVNRKDADAEKWYKKDGKIYRDIYKIEYLYDVSPVFQPAYNATTCSQRFAEVKALSEEIDAKMNVLAEEINNL